MSFRWILDPLRLLPSQSGLVDPPLREGAANGASNLDTQQEAITIGEPVPIVFCRRVDGVGGVLVSPGATEARYENDGTTNELTVNLMLVLSEGELPTIPYKDVFQRACRVGTWAQTYDRKAGTWTAGNAITVVSGKEFWNCPYYCGTSGRYENMTTLSYTNTHDDGDPTWDKQVYVFVRDGMKVTRILDDTEGPSNNVVDLALYLIRESSRLSESMLDLDQMEEAANFCDVNGFFYNGVFKESINLEEWLTSIGNSFLLRKGSKNGKIGFRPRLPIAADYTISTDPVSFVFTFTENHLLTDGFEISYIPLADRKPICAQVLWRQQPDDDLGLIRTVEVRYQGEAVDGPFEQYDLSAFCASENHAVKFGAYQIAKRAHISHTLRIQVSPGVYNGTLALGDIVRVRLRRETAVDQVSYHDYLYEVERIERTSSGVNVLDLMHFPIDSTGASVIAKEVAAAIGQGVTKTTGRTDFTCDESGRSEDETPLPDVGVDPTPQIEQNDDEVTINRADDVIYNLVLDDDVGTGDGVYTITGTDPDGNVSPLGDFGVDFGELGSAIISFPAEPGLSIGMIGPDGQAVDSGFYSVDESRSSGNDGGMPPTPPDNPEDPLDNPVDVDDVIEDDRASPTDPLTTSETLTLPESAVPCENGEACWYRRNKNTGIRTLINCVPLVGGEFTLSITTDEIDYIIEAEGQCPDSEPFPIDETEAVIPDTSQYAYARWTGTIYNGLNDTTTTYTSGWQSISGGAYLTIGPVYQESITGCYAIEEDTFAGGWELPPIGPIPWRATVRAIDNSVGYGGYGKRMGGLGLNGNTTNPCNFTSPTKNPQVSMPNTVATGVVYTISGVWQFSNDQSTIELEWPGDTDSIGPAAP